MDDVKALSAMLKPFINEEGIGINIYRSTDKFHVTILMGKRILGRINGSSSLDIMTQMLPLLQ